MKIIAICGQKGTGKDLVANTMCDLLDRPYRKIQFGDPVRDIVSYAFRLKGPREYTGFIRSIVTLQDGTELVGKDIAKAIQMRMRQYNSEQFIDHVEDQISLYKGYHPEQFDDVVFIITDLRFKDELKWCKANNATIIKVKRDSGVYDPLCKDPEIDDLFVDYVIDNNGTEQQLKSEIARILKDVV